MSEFILHPLIPHHSHPSSFILSICPCPVSLPPLYPRRACITWRPVPMRFATRRLAPALGAIAFLAVGFLLGQMRIRPTGGSVAAKGVVVSTGTAPAPALSRRGQARRRLRPRQSADNPRRIRRVLDSAIRPRQIRLYVNERIIEAAPPKRNIVVTPQEIDAVIDQDCGRLWVNKARIHQHDSEAEVQSVAFGMAGRCH